MSLPRTPPNTLFACASGSGGGSNSNLSNYDDDEEQVNKNPRKRRPHTLEYDFKRDLAAFRTEMMNFMKESMNSQAENITRMRIDIQQEIKDFKSTTENLTQEYKKVNKALENITTEHKKTQDKIETIENDLSQLKNRHSNSQTQIHDNEHDIIQEIQDRLQREKNIIMVGLPEKNDKNATERHNQDYDEVHKILKSIDRDCPKPNKILRLGKYNADRIRPLKIIFETPDTPRYLLKNRSKMSDNSTKIYSDQTPVQRKYIQSLQAELKEREKNGETNLSIKYIKGVPVITKIDTRSKN